MAIKVQRASAAVVMSGAVKIRALVLQSQLFEHTLSKYPGYLSVRHTTGLLLTLCAFSALTLPTTPAAAWVEAPLCVAQQPQLSEYTQMDTPSPLLCEPDEPFFYQQGPLWTAPISAEEARRAFKEATALADSSPTDALVKLRLVERAMPRIADHLAVQRAQLLLKLDRPTEACDAYRSATESMEPGVAADARIGLVSCLLDIGDRQGEAELDRLLRRYPALGERAALQVKLAKAREGWHNLSGALPVYRSIDLFSPETRAAADARDALTRLRDQGVAVPLYTAQEWVDRGERLVYRGTVEAGRSAVSELLELSEIRGIRGIQKGRVHILAARVARMEARWDAVRVEVAKAIECGIPTGEAERWLPRVAVETLEPGQGEDKVRRQLAGRPLKKLKPMQQRSVLDLAVHYGMPEIASEVLDNFIALGPNKLAPQMLFDSAVDALGVASPDSLRRAFEGLRQVRPLQLAASYFHARALEDLKLEAEARTEYREVSELDQGYLRYYGVWAEARIAGLDQLAAGSCERDERGGCQPDVGLSRRAERVETVQRVSAMSQLATVFGAPHAEPIRMGERAQPQVQHDEPSYQPTADDHRRETIVSRLGALTAAHGDAYPWLGRAVDLAELERYDDAAAEIGEVYMAYRDARGGKGRMRAGAEAVLTNTMQPRHECADKTRRDRAALGEWARMTLAEVADMLEEPGIALRLREIRGEPRPRAYSEAVERAAARFDLDPNLMFAVMRVESVYYRHIVSPAGAVGLMQIMPQTGMRIARALGMQDFNPRELLDPRRNLEFAAWYLSSLIRRFDGRIPLAVAAYNGGPHNVRLWINGRPKTMPLDAFIERIPFHETRGYVRRVMNNYGAYRAQEDLAMPNLAMSLPRPRPDAVAF